MRPSGKRAMRVIIGSSSQNTGKLAETLPAGAAGEAAVRARASPDHGEKKEVDIHGESRWDERLLVVCFGVGYFVSVGEIWEEGEEWVVLPADIHH